MRSKFATTVAAIGAALVLTTAAVPAQAQSWSGGPSYYDPGYARTFGFSPDHSYGPYAYEDANAGTGDSYCVQHYRSYNPATGTYLGRDGKQHSCP